MSKRLNERGFGNMGGGMPHMMTEKAKKAAQRFEQRIDRIAANERKQAYLALSRCHK